MSTPIEPPEGTRWVLDTPQLWTEKAAGKLKSADLTQSLERWASDGARKRLGLLLGSENVEPAALVQALIAKAGEVGSKGIEQLRDQVPNNEDENYAYVFLNGVKNIMFFEEEEAAG